MIVTCPSCRCSFPVTSAAPNGMVTPKQLELLRFIKERINLSGVAPTYGEMAAAVGLSSKGGVSRLVMGLEERGHIRRLPGRARAIALVEQART